MKKKELFKDDLKHLLKSDLKHIYYVEKLHSKAMVRLAKETTDPEIIKTVENVLNQSVKNRDRIETIFDNLKVKPRGKKSRGIEGMISEIKEIVDKSDKLNYVIVDIALLSAIQRIILYKLGAYKILKSFANLSDDNIAADLFDACYIEAKESEKKISRLIVRRVRPKAVELY